MSDTAGNSSIQLAARAFYNWFHGAESDAEGLGAIQAFLGSPVEADELQRLGERLRENQAFLGAQRPLIDKWRDRIESPGGLSDEEAHALIQELFEGFDHALLYEHGIRASSTLVQRDSINAAETDISNMPCWTLHLTLRGSALFLSDDMEQRVSAGDMMLLRPDAKYHYGLHPKSDQWEHLWALFQPRPHWSELLEWTELDGSILLLTLPDAESRSHLEGLFRELIKLGSDVGPLQSDLQHNKLEEILIRARGYGAPDRATALDPRIRQACDYMQQRLAKKFSIDEVAGHCNLSTSRFAHLFREQMGIGPRTWINDTRLQHARKLLLNSGDSISRIGTQVGYGDPAHFARYFRKNMGCSPRQFRQSFGG
jgi:AraC family transcriptional regulator of arabinose operon